MGKNQERREFFNKLILAVVLICSVCMLNCNIYIKILVVMVTLVALLFSCKYKWTSSKWFIVCTIFSLIINIYYDCRIYAPYRFSQSAYYNSQQGFSTSQVAYNKSGNSDVLLYLVVRDKSVVLYGNTNSYYNLLERFSDKCYKGTIETTADFLVEKQEIFVDMGRINPYNAFDCFELDDVPALREARNTYKPRLYISSEEIVEEKELVVAIDSSHNFYVMTAEQWEEAYNEK